VNTEIGNNVTADVRLRELAKRGELASSYREVADLLRDATPEVLRKAGAVLARVDAADVTAHDTALPVATVSVVGSCTLAPLVAPLHAELARHGFVPRVQVGGYGQYQMELRDPSNPVFDARPDLTLCLLDADEVFAGLPTPWSVEDVRAALEVLSNGIVSLAGQYLQAQPGLLVFNTIPLPRRWAAQLVDHRSKAALGVAWREFNTALLRLAERPGVVVIDSEPLLTETGPLAEPRFAAYAKTRLGDAFLAAYANEIGHLMRAVRGRTSKCLVLDLDGTVWGGTLAEDGIEGIEVADGPKGEAFHYFQLAAKQLGGQGVLLAVCSKNDIVPVRRALRETPALGVTEDDMAAVIANWGPKPTNLKQLAEQLNIGVDSLVFVDDSASERGMVREILPAVRVIAVDANEPALHVHRLLADGWFTTLEITDEDRVRGERYRTERQRTEFRETADSLTDYLAGLGTAVDIRRPADGDVGRVAQLTQRTNQFNLTTVRMDPAGVRRLLDDSASDVFVIRCTDRFGSHGLVGAFFTRWSDDMLVIDNFVLSCRVLARGVETACVSDLLTAAREAGARAVRAEFRPTAKNHRVAELYPEHGFTAVAPQGDDGTVHFEHSLTKVPELVPHVKVVSEIGWHAREGVGS
jgi:FkbH-like protein